MTFYSPKKKFQTICSKFALFQSKKNWEKNIASDFKPSIQYISSPFRSKFTLKEKTRFPKSISKFYSKLTQIRQAHNQQKSLEITDFDFLKSKQSGHQTLTGTVVSARGQSTSHFFLITSIVFPLKSKIIKDILLKEHKTYARQ